MVQKITRKKGSRGAKGVKPTSYTYAVPTQRQRSTLGGPSGGAYESVCAMTNPFCPQAKGSKIPDDDSANSIAYSVRNLFTVGTNAAGEAAVNIQARLDETFRVATAFAATVPSTYGAWSTVQEYTALNNAFSNVRVVSMGIRFYSTLAPTEQAGAIRFITTSEPPAAGVTLLGGLFDGVDTFPVAGANICWIARPQGTTWKEYHPLNTHLDYNSLAIMVYGAKASMPNAFTCEIVYNLECTVDVGTITAAMSTAGAAHSPIAMSAASRTHAKHNGIHEGPSLMSKLAGFAKSALVDVASQFLPGAMSYVFGPRKRPMSIMDVD